MRVALVCPYAWDRFGGVQSHIQALAVALRARGHEITIVAPRSSWPQPASEIVVAEGITYVGRAVSIPANGSLAPLAFGPLAARNVRTVLNDLRPDLVHLHEPLIPSLSLLALWGTRAPTVGTFHAASEGSLAYWAAQPMLRRAAERLTVRTVVSEAALTLVGRYFPGIYLTTPNGVDVGRFASAAPHDLGAGSNVLFFGRVERRKGLEVLVQAMTRLRDLDARLVIAGAGPEQHRCRNLARRLGVDAMWLGSPHDDEKPRIFQAAQVYCAPNLGGESFGIVLVEAMASGAPVVCSDLPGFRAVAGGAGLLAPPGDAGGLADALRAVLTDPHRAKDMSAAGLGVAKSFDWRLLSANVERVYERAVASGSGGERDMSERTAVDWGQPESRSPAGRAIAGRALLAFGLPLGVVVGVLIPVGSPVLVGAVIAAYAGGVLWWVRVQGARALRAAAAEPPRPEEAARMVNLVEGLAADLGITSPEVLVSRRGGANALVCLAGGPKVAVTAALLEEFTRTEQEAVAAHCLVRLHSGQVRSAQLALALGPFGASLAEPVGGFDDVAATALTRYPPALAAAIRGAAAVSGRYSGLWFVGADTTHVPAEQRASALADL